MNAAQLDTLCQAALAQHINRVAGQQVRPMRESWRAST